MKRIAFILFLFIINVAFAFSQNEEAQEKVEEAPFIIQHKPATFPGGEVDLIRFFERTVMYPKEALQEKLEEVVIASFIINKNGSLGKVSIINNPDTLFANEVQ